MGLSKILRATRLSPMSSYQQQVEKDMQRLEKMLHKVVGKDAQQITDDDTTRILNLACGACNEAETLSDFFGNLKKTANQSSGKKVEMMGIDVRAREIADAKRRFQSGSQSDQEVQKEYQFLTGDASKIDDQRAPDEHFDVVFLRHQNFWNGDSTWEKIFEQALSKLKTDGQLVITSYFDEEHRLALEAIQKLGGQLINSQQNLESRELPTRGKSIDRHVAVFHRKS